MKRIFTLFVFSLLCFSSFSQDKVLVFSGSGAALNVNSNRNLTADTLFGRNTLFSIGTGAAYGKWKGNVLVYYGINASFANNQNYNTPNAGTFYSIGPVVGVIKRVSLGGPLSYMPVGEAIISYSNNRQEIAPNVFSVGRGWTGGIFISPLSFSLQATKRMELLFALGRVDAFYSNSSNSEVFQQPATRVSNFNIVASLNAIGLRLLVKI